MLLQFEVNQIPTSLVYIVFTYIATCIYTNTDTKIDHFILLACAACNRYNHAWESISPSLKYIFLTLKTSKCWD